MQGFKRWAPLVGSALLAVTVVLRVLGQNEVAQAIESVGGLVGVTSAPTISHAELASAAAVIFGIYRKVKAELEPKPFFR